jgi:hypothetical protein
MNVIAIAIANDAVTLKNDVDGVERKRFGLQAVTAR